ncbi:hypothetical protein ACFQ1I_35730 [Kitasatospora arboriphila]
MRGGRRHRTGGDRRGRGPDRSWSGSERAADGARTLAAALPGRTFDAGARGCRVDLLPPDADANTMLTALRAAAARPARWLVVCLLGQLAADPRGRRIALVTAGSTPDNAYRRGLAWDWVVSAMVHGGQEETLLLVDAVADRDTWAALAREDAAGELLSHSRVPLWGRIGRHQAGRRGRDAVRPGGDGSFSGSWWTPSTAASPAHPPPSARRNSRPSSRTNSPCGTAARPKPDRPSNSYRPTEEGC